jgi:methylenetetrahydrofolate--tRNA-(uracil-5-)-methyltransferase
VLILGAGLAGCEAALILAKHNINVELIEMKPKKFTPAHHNPNFAELVCSNSLKSIGIETATGLLKEEMKLLGSVTIEAANHTRVPAGNALAVNREHFSQYITKQIKEHPKIQIHTKEQVNLPATDYCIVATGPLTTPTLSNEIEELFGEENFKFFDAASPIVTSESLDTSKIYFAARYNKGEADYLNCPLTETEYNDFQNALINAETASLHDFEVPNFFFGCMPIEAMAKKGHQTLRFGPLKPVGIRNPQTNENAYAIVQLRKEDCNGNLFNLVGFQTNLKWSEQKRVFGLIPGLKNAEFVRYGVMHRNTFINSPKILDAYFRTKIRPTLFFAGQITGVEGYLESAASGIVAGLNLMKIIQRKRLVPLPQTTMIGALAKYISSETKDFQPMNSNMGILPPLKMNIKSKKEKYMALSNRAIKDLTNWDKECCHFNFTQK